MDLYILRHAIAVDRGTPGFDDDSLRPLTEKGERKMRRIAQGMRALDLTFDAIYTSPFVRARHTAEIVAAAFDAQDKLALTPHLAVGGDLHELLNEINAAYGEDAAVLLVGHEPALSGLVSLLLSGGRDLAITLRKGGLCKLSASRLRFGRCATLEWLLTPRQLAGLQRED